VVAAGSGPLTRSEADDLYVAQANALQAQRATIAHTDTTAKDLFTLPAGAIIIAFVVNVTEAFDDSGSSDLLDIGDGTTADRFVADQDVGSAGLALVPSADDAALSAATVIQGLYTPGTGATAGAATITALYIVPGS
jgi:hypothetical protein